MTMRNARFKQKRAELFKQRKALTRQYRSRVESAINSKWTLREPPEALKALESERSCLRAQNIVIAVRDESGLVPDSNPEIIRNLKKIKSLTQKLNK